ncbi:arylesterase [Anditalea andensis]|uniref:GDSL family lipase n=1 Tax=Anditalea andensis TaxID=1048983 RepID=A0A074KWU5_9BACT|nr:arylesterase [Anditalea andensis]KEO73434.1 GDSL family lipase [Anditalea andensis]
MKKNNYPHLIIILFLLLGFACGTNEVDTDETEVVREEGAKPSIEPKTILFFGNSLTAGYGIDPEDAFPGIIQQKIDSLGLDYKIINGGLSGETTASGLNRLDWFLEEEPDIFILELGGNDGLRGIAVDETRKNLEMMIELVQTRYPDTEIVLAGMQIPPNMGRDYAENFRNMYLDIAGDYDLVLIPFLLEGVGGEASLNLPDGIHPTEEGHKIVAETVWEYLYPIL